MHVTALWERCMKIVYIMHLILYMSKKLIVCLKYLSFKNVAFKHLHFVITKLAVLLKCSWVDEQYIP